MQKEKTMFYLYAVMLVVMLAAALFGVGADVGIKGLLVPLVFSVVFTLLVFHSAVETGYFASALVLFGMGIAVWLGVMLYALAKHINRRAGGTRGLGLSAG